MGLGRARTAVLFRILPFRAFLNRSPPLRPAELTQAGRTSENRPAECRPGLPSRSVRSRARRRKPHRGPRRRHDHGPGGSSFGMQRTLAWPDLGSGPVLQLLPHARNRNTALDSPCVQAQQFHTPRRMIHAEDDVFSIGAFDYNSFTHGHGHSRNRPSGMQFGTHLSPLKNTDVLAMRSWMHGGAAKVA